MKIYIVYGCHKCVFRGDDPYDRCILNKNILAIYSVPENCPLKEKPRLVIVHEDVDD